MTDASQLPAGPIDGASTSEPEWLDRIDTRTILFSPSLLDDEPHDDDGNEDGSDNPSRERRSDYAEHMLLGNRLQLPGIGESGEKIIAWKVPLLNVMDLGDSPIDYGDLYLTYGDINALAGDFYGTDKPISDGADENDRRRRFIAAWDTLANNRKSQPEDVMRIQSTLREERVVVARAVRQKSEPSLIYEVMRNHDIKLGFDTWNGRSGFPSYGELALINWDHFGADARLAYAAGHAEAIHYAATQPQTQANLRYAYAMNAFADHYLQDLFSAGHLRTPRRALHDTRLMPDILRKGLSEIGLADKHVDELAKRMHDEECAIGLDVTAGPQGSETWRCYGDKRTFDADNKVNLERCLDAMQNSVREVYLAWQTREELDSSSFVALYAAPTPVPDQALAPLFRPADSRELAGLERRSDLFDRRKWEFTTDWKTGDTQETIDNSGLWKPPIRLD